jgi:hypothetical protein
MDKEAEKPRGIRGELKGFMRDYLAARSGPATLTEIRTAAEKRLGRTVPQSSVRSSLQDDRYFERVTRGVFRLRSGAS